MWSKEKSSLLHTTISTLSAYHTACDHMTRVDVNASAWRNNSLKFLNLLCPWPWSLDLQNPITSSVTSHYIINYSLVKFLPPLCKISCWQDTRMDAQKHALMDITRRRKASATTTGDWWKHKNSTNRNSDSLMLTHLL